MFSLGGSQMNRFVLIWCGKSRLHTQTKRSPVGHSLSCWYGTYVTGFFLSKNFYEKVMFCTWKVVVGDGEVFLLSWTAHLPLDFQNLPVLWNSEHRISPPPPRGRIHPQGSPPEYPLPQRKSDRMEELFCVLKLKKYG